MNKPFRLNQSTTSLKKPEHTEVAGFIVFDNGDGTVQLAAPRKGYRTPRMLSRNEVIKLCAALLSATANKED